MKETELFNNRQLLHTAGCFMTGLCYCYDYIMLLLRLYYVTATTILCYCYDYIMLLLRLYFVTATTILCYCYDYIMLLLRLYYVTATTILCYCYDYIRPNSNSNFFFRSYILSCLLYIWRRGHSKGLKRKQTPFECS